MSKLSSMLKSVKIPSFADIKAKFSKTSRSSDEKAFQEYIRVCERALNDEFKELQLFGQQNKDKMKFIEQCQKSMEKLSISYSLNNDEPELYDYLRLTGMHKGGNKLYKKVYKNYDECIKDQFGVKSFMKSFSKKVRSAKNYEEFDTMIRERIASMRTFLNSISRLLIRAYSVASGFMKEIKEYDKLGGRRWPQIKEQLLEKLEEMRLKVEPIIKEQNDNLGNMFKEFSKELSTNANINLVELFLIKNKDKVSSYGQIMKYSNLIGKSTGAVEYFNKEVDTVELTATANESAGILKAILNAKKTITGADETPMSDVDKGLFYQKLVNELQSKHASSLAKSHYLVTRKSHKMKELRDNILLVANYAANEIEEWKREYYKR